MSQPKSQRPFAIRAINGLGAAMAGLGLELPRLDERALLRAARKATGLDDFGGEGFREGMGRLLASLEAEARLNTLGRVMARQTIFRYLRNRLQLRAYRRAHPELDREEIRRPLFILGLPRTGTTILFNLLAQDPANRPPLGWEVEIPDPPPDGDSYQSDPRIQQVQRQFDQLDRVSPGLAAIHEFGALLPQECVQITAHEFLSVQFHVLFNVPSYQDWLDRQSFLPAYRMHRAFLQHLQHGYAGERWLLKSPGHLAVVEDLLQAYPDACIIHTHRDPLEVMSSLASLSYTLRVLNSDHADPLLVGRQQTDLWERNLKRALQARDRAGGRQAQFFDVRFEEVLADPIALVARIYQHFGLPLDSGARARMEAFLRDNPRDKHGSHRYSLGDFGLDPAKEAPRFAEYCQRFGIASRAAS